MTNKKLLDLIKNFDSFNSTKKAYIARVIDNLRKKSYHKNDKELMVNEWLFIDHPDNIRELVEHEECQLCGKPENIYQFRIQNKITMEHIWTGSICIKNFSIPVFDSDGERIKSVQKMDSIFNTNIKELKEKKRLELIKILIEGINKELKKKGSDRNYQMTYSNKKEGSFTAKQMKFLARLYKDVYDDFIPEEYIKLFKINMRMGRNKEELKSFTAFQWAQFSPILHKSHYCEKKGFTEEKKQSAINIVKYVREEYHDSLMKKIK